jgi:glycosyltransferase involved in cell wall biosynthesis
MKREIKRVWILNHYARTPDMPGGNRHYILGRHLVDRGYDVTIFASSFNRLQLCEMKLVGKERWRIEEFNGVKFVWLRTMRYRQNDWRRIMDWCSYMSGALSVAPKLVRENQVDSPDVVIGSSVHLLAVYAAYRLAQKFHCPFLAEIRDLWPQTLVDMGRLSERHPLTWALRQFERFLYRRAEKIIMLLPMAYEYTNSIGIPTTKIIWIPNGVDLSLYSDCTAGHNVKKGDTFTLMYAGAHGRANALDVLLEAARITQDMRRQDIRFVFVGDGPEKPGLVAKTEQWRLSNVEFHDPVSKMKLPQVLAEADAFVLVLQDIPLYAYGISLNKLNDYLAAMRPILLAGNPANNVVRDAGCGVTVPPGDPRALAEAAFRLADMPEDVRWSMAQRGRTYVEQNYDYTILAEQLRRCIEELE